MVFNDQLFHSLLSEVIDERSNVVNFDILGKKVTFSQVEFKLVIGLWLTGVTIERDTRRDHI